MNGGEIMTKKTINIILTIFFAVCGLLLGGHVVAKLLPHSDAPHEAAHLPWEEWPGFYAMYGFVACVLLVLIAKYILRPLVKRHENYYDD